jgi:protein TonB
VIATGARPGDNDSQRDLFTEETNTVLVFENGAVIRLSAAVATGQLLFLSHKESRREVVAQVIRKRDFRPTSCYVEVEFSERAPGFWGIEFVENAELVPANPQQEAAAELVQSARAISGKSGATAIAPSAQEVETLKGEVETLRKQLMSLQSQASAGIVVAPPAATPPQARPVLPATASQLPAPQVPSQALTAAPPEAFASPFSSTSRIAPPPPVEREDTTSFEDKPFPKPEIRVNRSTPSAGRAPNPKPAARGSFRPGVLRFALLTAALVLAVIGAALYLHWIPRLSLSSKHSSSSAPAPPAHAVAQPAATLPAAPQSVPVEAPKLSAPASSERPSAANAATVVPTDEQNSTITPAAIKRAVPHSSSQQSSASVAPLSQSNAFVPPRLIRSVRAVASPAALQYFDKGNTVIVTLDTFVDSSGQVKSMKVLSGPASLHQAAMTALKQYQYAPARRGGKPVGAHVTVPIKFLFEP